LKEYDAIVIGSGCGMNIVMEALAHQWKVALVDRGPLGGTCPNLGCIPSKMLIHVADRLLEAEDSRRLGVELEVRGANFARVMERMRKGIAETQAQIRHGVEEPGELAFFEGEARFAGDYTLEVNGGQIKGKRIFLASGSRPLVPSIPGLDRTDYLTNETLLQLTTKPESMVIIGGGYVGAEYGHFFAAMGTKVTIIEMMERLVPAEEPEISELLKEELSSRMTVLTGARVEQLSGSGKETAVHIRLTANEEQKIITGERVLVAAGRRSNADLLHVDRAGIKTDNNGFVATNEYLETNRKNIVAVGDANGRYMFTHVANKEAVIAAHNAVHDSRVKMDYSTAPHAVYSHPQIASVGMTEATARKDHRILVGRTEYSEVAKGEAMMVKRGFAKAVVEKDKGRLLGFHVIGPYAPIVIQEAINAMAMGGSTDPIRSGMHIHPELPELVQRTLGNMEEG